MLTHDSCTLQGPRSKTRDWWPRIEFAEKPTRTGRSAKAPIRNELVERVRREIADGVYETPEKWEAALDRLFESLDEK